MILMKDEARFEMIWAQSYGGNNRKRKKGKEELDLIFGIDGVREGSIIKNYGLKSRRLKDRQITKIEKSTFGGRDNKVRRFRALIISSTT